MRRNEAKHNKRAASKIAQTKANIAMANADAAENLSPFASSANAEPVHSTQEADAISAESKRKPAKTEVEPTPVAVNRTIFF